MSKHKGVIDTEFKIGDKVKINSIGQFYGAHGIVKDKVGDCSYRLDLYDGNDNMLFGKRVIFASEHLEKVDEPKPEPTGDGVEPVIGEGDAKWALIESYKKKIFDLLEAQEAKGIRKYGVPLEQNKTLTTDQRIAHLQEELVDGLYYCEHLRNALGAGGITANDYQRAALRTAQTDKYSPDDLLQNGVMGLCGEAGEVIDLVKKCMFQGHELDKEKIKQELGDCTWYISIAAYALGFSLSDIMEANISKLKERYPGGFSKERSINRKEYKTEGRDSEKVSTDVPGEGTQEAGPVRDNDRGQD